MTTANPALPTLRAIGELVDHFSDKLAAAVAIEGGDLDFHDQLRRLSADLERHGADAELVDRVRRLADAVDAVFDLTETVGCDIEVAAAGVKIRRFGDDDDGSAA